MNKNIKFPIDFLVKFFSAKNKLGRTSSLFKSLKFFSVGKRFYVGNDSVIIGGNFITIGDNFHAHKRFRIEAINSYGESLYRPKIIIGNNVSINYDCHIGAINFISIGENVMIASRVFISDHFHGDTNLHNLMIPPHLRKLYSKGPVIIEDNVLIGEGVSILSNVRIGKGSVIGSNSVVTKDIPPFSIVVGIPGRVLGSTHL